MTTQSNTPTPATSVSQTGQRQAAADRGGRMVSFRALPVTLYDIDIIRAHIGTTQTDIIVLALARLAAHLETDAETDEDAPIRGKKWG